MHNIVCMCARVLLSIRLSHVPLSGLKSRAVWRYGGRLLAISILCFERRSCLNLACSPIILPALRNPADVITPTRICLLFVCFYLYFFNYHWKDALLKLLFLLIIVLGNCRVCYTAIIILTKNCRCGFELLITFFRSSRRIP